MLHILMSFFFCEIGYFQLFILTYLLIVVCDFPMVLHSLYFFSNFMENISLKNIFIFEIMVLLNGNNKVWCINAEENQKFRLIRLNKKYERFWRIRGIQLETVNCNQFKTTDLFFARKHVDFCLQQALLQIQAFH